MISRWECDPGSGGRHIATAARHSIAAGLFGLNAIDVAVHIKRIVF
jgi:hypothetical protein